MRLKTFAKIRFGHFGVLALFCDIYADQFIYFVLLWVSKASKQV